MLWETLTVVSQCNVTYYKIVLAHQRLLSLFDLDMSIQCLMFIVRSLRRSAHSISIEKKSTPALALSRCPDYATTYALTLQNEVYW